MPTHAISSLTQAQAMCGMLPGFPDGQLATLYSAEDMEYFKRIGALAEGDAPNIWVGYGDFMNAGEHVCGMYHASATQVE